MRALLAPLAVHGLSVDFLDCVGPTFDPIWPEFSLALRAAAVEAGGQASSSSPEDVEGALALARNADRKLNIVSCGKGRGSQHFFWNRSASGTGVSPTKNAPKKGVSVREESKIFQLHERHVCFHIYDASSPSSTGSSF